MTELLINGAGIGGWTASLALLRQGASVELWEQASEFSEVGAGIQLGSNSVRLLHQIGLSKELEQLAWRPSAVQAFDARSGELIQQLPLQHFTDRYGAPYLCIHRADLHQIIRQAAQQHEKLTAHLNTRLISLNDQNGAVHAQAVQTNQNSPRETISTALIGADGLWSQTRELSWNDGSPVPTGHWAYRALIPMKLLPAGLRPSEVHIWMAPEMHVVHYPVRSGEWLNLVVLVESSDPIHLQGWDLSRSPEQTLADVKKACKGTCSRLQDLLRLVEVWKAWSLCQRSALGSAADMAKGRVALLGDAAHPMLPYLAQGAGMAIEDAFALASCWSHSDHSAENRLQQYAQIRWRRNSSVQQRAAMNAKIFHAKGLMAWGRNALLRNMGASVMDMPWLYGY